MKPSFFYPCWLLISTIAMGSLVSACQENLGVFALPTDAGDDAGAAPSADSDAGSPDAGDAG